MIQKGRTTNRNRNTHRTTNTYRNNDRKQACDQFIYQFGINRVPKIISTYNHGCINALFQKKIILSFIACFCSYIIHLLYIICISILIDVLFFANKIDFVMFDESN